MSRDYSGGAYHRTNSKFSKLGKTEQRLRLSRDIRRWLNSGHHIQQLPPGPVTAVGRLDKFSILMIESGYAYEL
ncbi:hypothetical protein NX722_05530 [Endozoicomonas gorgoniicola]|uniref:Uncharacterized protein n=1 Tax=Endozoicomonas gorgoniicola TaxID=1234144 RepID=A0ABT3MRW8_9GAMM|nr:hypothetical protein [Endozoicomonas gorgoniicola]MCW7552113.1 hypothetical protein [Endozoicomonas gorgoniicola]